ncbi:restriction endonuclease subunit S [Flavihumibacter sp. ZG627]|uniref:restriction endonuclease subunit S n=1 Tax=Flavihumibacter sp. ZG627 TaxID=1463156 RepID=UPI00057E8366|nr:restriction endonuclease subunit S [Flavihumibacter sp. ZG627]KIC92598.1 hypothetical protein HY58_03470 [Flavihumibacter sp. ZG627]
MSGEYKVTPIGDIPKDWNVCHVEDFLLDKKGAMKIGPFGSQLKKDSMVPDGIKVYGQENIFAKDMSFGDRFISHDHFERLKTCELFPGDFIISMMGTIGKCMVVPKGIRKGIMDSHLLRLQLNEEKMLTDFLTQLFSSPLVLDQVKKLAVGGIMDGLSSGIVKKILFVCPPPDEQEKSAEILFTVDEKIEVIEEQIAQTTELKKGLMQRLLIKGIGHTHFKESPLGEIPESWQPVILDDIADVKRGLASQHLLYVDSPADGVRLIRINDFKRYDPKYIKETPETQKLTLQTNDILIAGTGATAGITTYITEEWHGLPFSYNAPRIRVNGEVIPRYLFYYLNSSVVIDQQQKLFTGNAQPFLDTRAISNFKIGLPPMEEQRKIASILTEVDHKISILQDKKILYVNLKKGLMQKLLTGKLRVNHLIESEVLA